MPKRISDAQRLQVLDMLAQGYDRDTIATAVEITPGQVSAVSAHVKMGTYQLPEISSQPSILDSPQTRELVNKLKEQEQPRKTPASFMPILI